MVFFDGLSLDEAHIATHKTFQFCGLEPLKLIQFMIFLKVI